MTVPIVKQWSEAVPYLDMLADTIDNDLLPLLSTKGGALHTISREFCCYVDYLGTLYTGLAEHQESSNRFCRYLREVLAQVNQGYAGNAELVLAMFRHGLVHEFDPKTLINQAGRKITWVEFTTPSTGQLGSPSNQSVTHLQRTAIAYPPGNSDEFLPISVHDLLHDLKQSIRLFREDTGGIGTRIPLWNRAAALLNVPTPYNFG